MESIHKPARWLLLLTVLGMLAAACGGGAPGGQATGGATDAGGAATEAPEATEPAGATEATEATEAAGGRQEGGSVVFGADQQPDIMNPTLTAGNLFATSIIVIPMLQGAYTVLPDFTYTPQLIDGEAEVTEDPFTVTYKIRDEAAWSDGEPITADDFIFTFDTYMNKKWDITSRDGYDKISKAEKVDDKTVKFTFKQPFAPYKTLFGTILPKHELQGKNFNQVWNDEITVVSGPFEFDRWQKGQQLTIKRNENYWGEPKAALDEITFRFIEDSNTQVQALEAGEIDMFYPQPQVDLVEQVEGIDGVTSQTKAGTVWEHLDFNFAVKPLDQKFVREAIARGIDREAIAGQLIKPINPDAVPLQNTIWMSNQEQYEPHFDKYTYDPAAAEKLLTDNGCEKSGGVYECDGQKLSFRYVTTAGNELRELQLQVIQQQLKQIGIEIKPDIGDAATVFADVLPAGKEKAWDLFNFAWVGSPDPFGSNAIFKCKGDQNYNSYCNQEVTKLLDRTDTEIDPAQRTATYNEADNLMSEDLPLLPLYQKPTFFAWNEKIQGPEDNPTNTGPTWNTEEWFLTE